MSGETIGYIESIRFGLDDREWLGVHLSFKSGGWGVATSIHVGEHFEQKIKGLLDAAKVRDVPALKGKPVALTFDGNLLRNWRILTEVIPE